MKITFKCKTCGKDFDRPDLAHVAEELEQLKLSLRTLPTAQFFAIQIDEDWA